MGHLIGKDVYRELGRKIDGLAVRAPWNDCPRPARRKRVRPLVDERFCLGCGVWR